MRKENGPTLKILVLETSRHVYDIHNTNICPFIELNNWISCYRASDYIQMFLLRTSVNPMKQMAQMFPSCSQILALSMIIKFNLIIKQITSYSRTSGGCPPPYKETCTL